MKKLGIALSLVLCAVLLFALGTVALAAEGEVAAPALSGEFTAYSTCYDYGEEVYSVVLETGKALDAATVAAEDFEVYFEAVSCGSLRKTTRTISSIAIDGTTVTLDLKLTGSGTNNAIDSFTINIVGEVADKDGNKYAASDFEYLGQVNEKLDQFIEGATDKLTYRLFVPEETEGAAPLYVWLHGGGEFGTDNRVQVSCSSLIKWTEPAVQDIFDGLYILAVQTPSGAHNPANIMEAILEVAGDYNIDMRRIYVSGCSMGGMGTHDMITAYPDFFAAAMPNCPASTLTEAAAKTLVDLPIIYVHALNDGTCRINSSIDSYDRLVAAGSDNVWCAFFENNGKNPVSGGNYDGHWSWVWIHNNFTSKEDVFVDGEGVYTNNNREYPYVSTPLAKIGEGYDNIASWLADQVKPLVVKGNFNIYSSCYDYGEEVYAAVIDANVELNPETVSAEDFNVYFGSRKTARAIESIEIDGTEITLNFKMTGAGTNTAIGSDFYVDLVGEVTDVDGTAYVLGKFTCVGQINPDFDQFIEGKTDKVQYRLFVPENADGATPLYVWLHGAGEFGTDNRKQVTCSNLADWTEKEVQDIFGGALYIAAIQTPSGGHKAADIMGGIMQICDDYNIDMSRIYLAGCSMGGAGVHTVITAYPDFFAAAIPNCPASTINAEQAAKLVDLPILYVHAEDDTSVRITNSINSYNNIVAAGSDNIWCAFFKNNGLNPVTGNLHYGHWSWIWIHKNFTSLEAEYIKGAGVYTRNGVDYPYYSTPLSEIGEGYGSVAEWLADQSKPLTLEGDFNIYSSFNDYGEEVYAVVIDANLKLDAETVSAEDFNLYFGSRKTARAVESIEINGREITLNLKMTGSGTNTEIGTDFYVDFVGEVADINGNVFNAADFTCVGQINEKLDQFLPFATDKVNYRLFVPETTADKAPLYVWLHGGGEFGNDNRKQVSCSSLANWTEPEVQDIFGGLYILAVQTRSGRHNPADVMEAILEVCENYNIDMGRIFVAGCSMGGMGTHDMITTYPDFFCAAAPNCPASTINEEQAAKLVDLPILYVHAVNDNTCRINNSITSYNNIVAAGSDNIWCAFFTDNGQNPYTGRNYDGHWSWVWIHKNFTSNEDQFIDGEGVYSRNGVDYPYVSTPLSEIGDGYANIAEWFAAQKKLVADFNFYSTCYDYGEEVNTVVIDAGVEFDVESLDASDFEVYFEAVSCGSLRKTNRTIESFEVDGTKLILNLKMTGSGTNAPIGTSFYVNLVGEIKDVDGGVYITSDLTCLGQLNTELDQFIEGKTDKVQYRLYVPEVEGEAPMYVWLHGAGEFGTDNRSQVSCSSLVNWIDPSVQDIFGGLYIAAIQTPSGGHNAQNVMEAILQICNDYDIDMSRIFISGCSMGGAGVHTMITAYPDFFCAAAPNCPASTINATQAELLVDLPILYVHAANDNTCRLTNSINSYNNIVAAGSDNVWCAFFANNGKNPITGGNYDGHWSWIWLHNNFTSTEPEFIVGEGEYNGLAYYSTPLADIGDGYANVAEWFADQVNENVIYVEEITAAQGEAVEIPVYVDNAAGISTFTVQLNSDELVINEVVAGDALAKTVVLDYNVENGKVTWVGLEDIVGDGVLFTVKATVVDPTADGEYAYSVDVVELRDGAYEIADSVVIGGTLVVVNPHYAGDVTLDGSINNADLVGLARYLVNLVSFNEEQLTLADFDGSGAINNADLVKLARYIVAG